LQGIPREGLVKSAVYGIREYYRCERKTPLLSHLNIKRSFCQDRLGTDIGKEEKKRCVFGRGVVLKRHVDRVQSHVLSARKNTTRESLFVHLFLNIISGCFAKTGSGQA
jgi:hypothetical protein